MENVELEFETHRQRFKVIYANDEIKWYEESSKMHSLVLNDALFKLFTELTILSDDLHSDEARYFLRFGALPAPAYDMAFL
jgi:hypothetical protein